MRAQVLRRWGGEVELADLREPEPGPGDVLVKVEACGVGRTVLNCMAGNLGNRPEHLPRVPGHELVGTVVVAGPGTAAPPRGTRVMAYFYLACWRCDFCRLAHEPLCRALRGNVGVATDGGYAEYVALPGGNLLPVPDGVDPVPATAIPDAIATPFHVCRRAAVVPGDVVAVIGAAGGVGVHMVQMARAFGGDVVAIDLGGDKLEATRALGAGAVVNGASPDALARVRTVAGRPPTVAIDLVGSQETLALALDALAPRGRLVLLTTFPGVAMDVSPRRMVAEELIVLGSRYASRWEVGEAARLVAEGRIRPIVSETVPLDRVGELHQKLRANTLLGRGAVIPA